MWSHKRGAALDRGLPTRVRPVAGLVAALGLMGLCTGCFQPLYGERSLAGSGTLRAALASVEVVPIEAPGGTATARIGVEVRNALTFELNGGAGPAAPTHRLITRLGVGANSLIVDPTTGRPEYEIVLVDASYLLVEIASGRTVLSGIATTRTSYDLPGQQQRLNIIRGQRDAQSRAALIVVEQIRTRLASYFATGS